LLKAELKRRNVTYQELVEKLATLGVTETPENIANKISRESSLRFSGAMFGSHWVSDNQVW
jgi:hypothetical protein